MRVYLPATLPRVERWLAAGEARLESSEPERPAGLAFAVTPSLREWYREGDLDELEHVAQVAAAVGSLELLGAEPAAPRRRVVIAADLDESAVSPASSRGRAAVTLRDPVPVSRWGSALVDAAEAAGVVELAVANIAAAASGDADAQFALDEAEAYELGWYAVQELRHLVEAL